MAKWIVFLTGAVLIIFSFVRIDFSADHGGSGVALTIKGAVKNETVLTHKDISKLKSSLKRVKMYNDAKEYAGSCEMKGVNLCDILSFANISKRSDDGFDRELDMYVVVRGGSGRSAVFSYGEIFLNGEPGSVFLTESARNIFPHKHEDLKPFGFDMHKWTGAPASYNIDLKNCAACHNGKDEKPVYFPKGFCVYASFDRSSARFIEDVRVIEVCQIAGRKIAPEKDKENMWCDSPVFSAADKTTSEISAASLASFPRASYTENTVGMGKGFHGRIAFEGFDMAPVLKNKCAGDIDIARSYVVVTAADGYRSLFSGAEIFEHANGPNLLLIDRQDGKDLQKGDGRFRAFIKSDFFIDRSVRSVREVYYNIIN